MKTTINKEDFLSKKRIGLILRTFARNEGDITGRLEMMQKMISNALDLRIEGQEIIKRVDVLIWADKRFESDCGKTHKIFKKKFEGAPYTKVHIQEVTNGDLFCGVLNYGVAIQARGGIDYSIIASPDAYSYMNNANLLALVDAVCRKGALVAGVAINELTESVKEGRIANTFAIWHNIALQSVGGFDLRAAKAKDEREAMYLRGWEKNKGNVFYEAAGVEEIIPLARLVDLYGQCIAPILPQGGDGAMQYQVPDRDKQYELWKRHISKMGTKLERQTYMLAQIGFDPSFLKGGIIKEA